jgi:hypothetical protein
VPSGVTGPPCHWGTSVQGYGPPGWGFDARLTTFFCKKIIVAKSKDVKPGSNLAISSKEGYGTKRTVLQMMMMMTMIFIY